MPDELDLRKLAAICELFSSEHDSERATAATLANKLVRDAGFRWADIIVAPTPLPLGIARPQKSKMSRQDAVRRTSISATERDRLMIDRLLMRSIKLKPKDREFVSTCARQQGLTSIQRKTLCEIYDKQFPL